MSGLGQERGTRAQESGVRSSGGVAVCATRLCVIAFLSIVVSFHFVRRDLDPLARGISRYQFGRFGVAMDAAFVLLGVAFVSASTAARAAVARRLLAIAGIAAIVVACFPLSDTPPLADNVVHQTGGALMLFCGLAGAALSARPGTLSRIATWSGCTATVVFLAIIALRLTSPAAPLGLAQRGCVLATCVLLLTVRAKGRLKAAPTS